MIRRIATVFALAVFASASLAAESAVVAEKVCDQACAKECSKCPIETAMAALPKLTYLVGKEATCCSQTAAKLAKEQNTNVKFVVANKTFEDQGKATLALTEETEKFLTAFTTTSECKVSGKFTVAGKELCCSVMAGERAELAKNAMKKVEMAYLVGDEKCSCPNQAAALAKETGKDKVFLVAGQKTCCSVDARLKLAQAKYKAAVEALARADAPKKTDKS